MFFALSNGQGKKLWIRNCSIGDHNKKWFFTLSDRQGKILSITNCSISDKNGF